MFPEALLKGCDSPSAAGGMVNSKVSHHGLDWRVLWSEKFAELTVDPFVRDNESCLVAVDH